MDVRVLADALVALRRCCLDANEEANIKVDSQAEQGLNALTVLVRHTINREEHHAEGLLMTIRLAKRRGTVLVVADVGLASAQHSHVSEGDAQKPIVGQARNGAFKERNCRAVWIQVNHVKECFVASVLKHQINRITGLDLILVSRTVIELKVLLHELCSCAIDIVTNKPLDRRNFLHIAYRAEAGRTKRLKHRDTIVLFVLFGSLLTQHFIECVDAENGRVSIELLDRVVENCTSILIDFICLSLTACYICDASICILLC